MRSLFAVPLLTLLWLTPSAAPLRAGQKPSVKPPDIWLQDVAISRDGRQIAFSRYLGVGKYRDEGWKVWVADRDGSHARPVLTGADYVSFSPDGKRLAAGMRFAGDWEIVSVKTDGTDLRRLTRRQGEDAVPSWSPDGGSLVFSSKASGNMDLWRMDANGGGLERLTTDPAGDYNPVYSPDGTEIVFYRERGDEQDQIWVLDLKTHRERRITDGTGHNFFPFYLPDGRLAWSGQPGPKGSAAPRRLWVREASGEARAFGPAGIFFARVAGDGSETLFLLQDSEEKKIYRLGSAGGEAAVVVDVRKLGER